MLALVTVDMGRPVLMDVSAIVVLVVVTALVFDFINGFHDTANAMAASPPDRIAA